MSEINGPKFSVNQINYNGIQKQNTEEPVIEEVKEAINDRLKIKEMV